MLLALDISSSIDSDGSEYQLSVTVEEAGRALSQLALYERERRALPAPVTPPPLRAGAWIGATCYVAVLMGVALAVSNGWWRADAFSAGALEAGRVQSGQWWRAWTALTLHLDGNHLFANLGAGVWFGYLAARQLGSGNAWLLIVSGAALANWLEAWFGPATHRAVGASTAVFTALGLLSAHTWFQRYRVEQHWARRWGPLIAGVVLLGWLGSEGEGTDLVAHAISFVVGCVLGAAAAVRVAARALAVTPQWFTGLLTMAALAVAWLCALRS